MSREHIYVNFFHLYKIYFSGIPINQIFAFKKEVKISISIRLRDILLPRCGHVVRDWPLYKRT